MAERPPNPLPRRFQEIRNQALSRLFGRIVVARVLALPVAVALALWVAHVDPTPWRRQALLALAGFITVFFVLEFVRWRRRGVGPRALGLNLGGAALGLVAVAAATGGLGSPILPVWIVVAVAQGLLLPPLAGLTLALVQVLAVWAFAAAEAHAHLLWLPLLGAPMAPARVWTTALLMSAFVGVGFSLGRSLRSAFEEMMSRLFAARAESLGVYAERAGELAALSGEIAHELKNPLASVKGLAGLLAADAPPGKPSERLRVLRGEVDRMQVTLEEFLNFSRPLVPLAVGPVSLLALAREVVTLHEGVAADASVALRLEGEAAAVQGDGRKLKQVLVNLVLNALEASTPGGEVVLEVSRRPDGGAVVQVLDRGRGIAGHAEARMFEAGVTTKARGSGLGLTIARALARQHGGEVRLTARPGGGAVAEMALPEVPVLPETEEGVAS